jgi:cysteine desulfurase
MRPIYLDYAATTPVDPRVADKMCRYLTADGIFGNPSSSHVIGHVAKHAIEQAREQVAALIGADPREVIWTSGATESNNLALKGAADLYQRKGKHIVTLQTEHKTILDPCQHLEKLGFQVTYLTPEKNGLLDLEKFQAALRPDTILVSVMYVNNELGVVQDIPAIAEITAARGILLHVDAAQAAGKIPVNIAKTPIDLMSVCAHKIYGPKGIGALYLRRKPRVKVAAQIHGGGQEQGMRSGTLATHQIVGMGEAFALAQQEMVKDNQNAQNCCAQFLQGISGLPFVIHGDLNIAIPQILNLRFGHIPATALIRAMPDVAISTSSACMQSAQYSHVLKAIGLSNEESKAALRFSFGRFTTKEEVDFVVGEMRRVLMG